MMGRTNARVLPVPVWAVATKSRPASAGAIACACTGVGWTKPCFARLLLRGADSESSEKFFIFDLRKRIGEPTTGYGRGVCGSTSNRLQYSASERFLPGDLGFQHR